MIRRLRAYFRRVNSRFRQTEQIYMVLAALVIGLIGGLAAIIFRLLIGGVAELSWRNSSYTAQYLAGLPAWWKVLAPAAGGLVVGLITYRFAREARGHGVPEVMNIVMSAEGIKFYPVQIRYAWPTELDLMTQLAGLRLRHRWGGWQREPFTATSVIHVSVYEKIRPSS